jgi:replicative DNA helicase
VFEIAEASSRGKQGFLGIDELAARVVTRMDELYHSDNPSDITGVPTGFTDLDQKTAGLQPGDLIIVAGRPSMGKAQPLDAKVRTVSGWKRMGDLKLGDELASIDGGRSLVSGFFPQGPKQLFRVRFSDGRATECCGEHLWRVYYRDWESPRVLSTHDVARLLTRKRYQHRLWIDLPDGIFGQSKHLPLDPWILGALLGDGKLSGGSVMFSTAAMEMLERLQERAGEGFVVRAAGGYDYRIVQAGGHRRKGFWGVHPNGIKTALESLGLWGIYSEAKFIPEVYLNASRSERVSLLQGLLDTDGWVERWGSIRIATSSERLAGNIVELVRSLGGWCSLSRRFPTYSYKGEKRRGMTSYVCNIRHPNPRPLVSLTEKRARIPERPPRNWRPVFVSIEPTRVAEAQCITVTHPSRLYITDDYVVTHNTAFSLNIAEHVGMELGLPVAVYSMEMSGEQVAMRLLGSIARVSQHKIRTGRVEEADWANVTAGLGKLQNANIYIDESGALNPLELRARARRLYRQCGKLGLIVVDYLQLMSASRADSENRATELSEISRSLKALAKELHVPIVALSQLNRGVESRTDRRPLMSDLRESGAIEQDSDLILFIYRDEVYRPDTPDKGIAEIIIGKQRNGPIGTVKLTFRGEFTRFENYANPDRF